MTRRLIRVLLSFGAVVALVTVAGVGPVAGSVQAKPRAGAFRGTETGPGGRSPVTFVVAANRHVLRAFMATAAAKTGCKAHYIGFRAPTGPFTITAGGRFTKASTAYPGPRVTVRVTGRFTSATSATGHVTVRFKAVRGCDASSRFVAKRVTSMSPGPAT